MTRVTCAPRSALVPTSTLGDDSARGVARVRTGVEGVSVVALVVALAGMYGRPQRSQRSADPSSRASRMHAQDGTSAPRHPA